MVSFTLLAADTCTCSHSHIGTHMHMLACCIMTGAYSKRRALCCVCMDMSMCDLVCLLQSTRWCHSHYLLQTLACRHMHAFMRMHTHTHTHTHTFSLSPTFLIAMKCSLYLIPGYTLHKIASVAWKLLNIFFHIPVLVP